jgi:hypothetical protein
MDAWEEKRRKIVKEVYSYQIPFVSFLIALSPGFHFLLVFPNWEWLVTLEGRTRGRMFGWNHAVTCHSKSHEARTPSQGGW